MFFSRGDDLPRPGSVRYQFFFFQHNVNLKPNYIESHLDKQGVTNRPIPTTPINGIRLHSIPPHPHPLNASTSTNLLHISHQTAKPPCKLYVDSHAGFYSLNSYVVKKEFGIVFFSLIWGIKYDVECMCIYRFTK